MSNPSFSYLYVKMGKSLRKSTKYGIFHKMQTTLTVSGLSSPSAERGLIMT